MERNLDRRIEAIFPISQASDIAQVEEILKLCAADDQYSWTMNGAGFYEREEPTLGISVQDILMEKANLEARKPAPSLM